MKTDLGIWAFPAVMLAIAAGWAIFGWLISLHARRRLAEIQGLPPELVTTKRNFDIPKALLRAAERIARETPLAADCPPLRVGDQCLLLGEVTLQKVGVMTVVECNATDVIVAWDDGNQEKRLSREILRRYRPPEGPVRRRKAPKAPLEMM